MRNYGLQVAEDAGEEKMQRAVPSAMSQLQFTLSTLESNIERLRDQLVPVLSSAPPDKDGNGKATQLHSVPLAAELSRITERIDALNDLTLDAINRLHV